MNVHYINILIFALPLNIFVTLCHVCFPPNACIILHTSINKPTKSQRSLCECDIYMPHYDNNPELKNVMENYNRQISQRFQDYDKRIKGKLQKCKEQCNKDIQKIILKDKIEKELTEKLATLDTNIATKNIPTCVFEKSLADKIEKFCLKCGYGFGGVVPSLGLLGGMGMYGWKIAALAAAEKAATTKGLTAGKTAGDLAGVDKFIDGLRTTFFIDQLGPTELESVFTPQNYTNFSNLSNVIHQQYRGLCSIGGANDSHPMCEIANTLKFVAEPGQVQVPEKLIIETKVSEILAEAKGVAAEVTKTATKDATSAAIKTNTATVQAGFESYITYINASIITILIIVLVMVIIYLILRYRRKKKMKKKLQYIKLLKE
ncbi:PIR protein, putative [Plasmodium sp. gorilla clade G1]|nr:PIR protein, putative [Plasmodium sp. gorilla clade G1]